MPNRPPSRSVTRREYPELLRIERLEEDADTFEEELREGIAAIRRAQKYSNGIGVSILVSLVIALAAIAVK